MSGVRGKGAWFGVGWSVLLTKFYKEMDSQPGPYPDLGQVKCGHCEEDEGGPAAPPPGDPKNEAGLLFHHLEAPVEGCQWEQDE